jgi:hypothetical protein
MTNKRKNTPETASPSHKCQWGSLQVSLRTVRRQNVPDEKSTCKTHHFVNHEAERLNTLHAVTAVA